jgi:subtilisin family serine protease
MRNWHHRIIKIQEARNLLTTNNLGDSNIHIGVIEGQIEFSKIDNNSPLLNISNYRPTHNSFSDITGTRKVFLRRNSNNRFTHDLESLKSDMHVNCVTGIIAGNEDTTNLVEGICPRIRVINSNDFQDALHLALVNNYSNSNIRSLVYKSINNNTFSNNGPIDSLDNYSNIFTSIINCSFNIKVNPLVNATHPNGSENKNRYYTSLQIDFILKELFAYARNGRGTLVIVSAGNGDSNGFGFEITDNDNSSQFRATVFSNKTLIVAASSVNLDYYDLSTYNIPNPVFKEELAMYSNYGRRIDLCAPSGPDANPSRDDVNIYAPTITHGGDVGTNDEIFNVLITQSNNSNKLTLSNVRGVFKGQSIEIGVPNTYTHEIRYIEDVKMISGTNDVEITLDEGLKYTKNKTSTGNYNLVNTTARLLVFKKNAQRYYNLDNVLVNNRLRLDNLKGIKASSANPTTSQRVYIYEVNNINGGIYTEITDILNPDTGVIQISHALTFTEGNSLILIPDQITATVKCSKIHYFDALNQKELNGFFIGQQVLLKSNLIGSITDKGSNKLMFSHVEGIPNDTYTIKSLAYGNFSSRFSGTSAATPIVTGLAGLILSTNSNLNAVEIKHILKSTTDQIGGVTYNDAPSNILEYNFGYTIHKKFGTGRVNAEKAIKLARNWHCSDNGIALIHPEIPVLKPRLEIADKISNNNIVSVPTNEPVDSPDIWVSRASNSNTTPVAPFNEINTINNQYINIKVRNTGNRRSFKESDLRIFVAFTDDENPAFEFPAMWYDQTEVKLLAVKEIPIIEPNSHEVIQVEWNDIAAKWNNNWNPLVNGRRKRTYILAHIAPFDGIASVVQTNNIRNNKQLTCKEIIVTHNGVNDGTAYIPGNKLDIIVGNEVTTKSFNFGIENILNTQIGNFKIKATKKNNNTGQTIEEVFYKKTGSNWSFETPPSSNWIVFDTPSEINGNHLNYKNINIPHTINVNNNQIEVKLEIVNT